ncbi:HDOD domain-containing protein [Tindallia californiensis]|uniref:HD-like signal output (HDOD) domain, no enzymatic activity n=1 Tax=Tindallia californiensis TaxID=159292 RepID=A0A1H3K9Z0_9FIRM|nr:HDOD domain-containing protein [Tindallia californiensis]SDY48354.1 HD-like signal output (HDOD) domain, no enzymatic activity [Tindallia californiensis]
MKKISIQEVIDRVQDIPAFPMTVSNIIRLTEDPDSTVQDIEKEITKDQSLTARVLRFANSTHYGYSRKISTISQATVVLGFQAIKSIALAATVSKMMARELPGYAMEKEALWSQSQTCAIAARLIAKKTRYPRPDEAYVAGLLRDVGKVILNHYLTSEMSAVQEAVERDQISFMQAEESVLGFHHGQIGAKIAEKWNLPDALVEAIAYHHEPEQANINEKLVAITHVADATVMMLGVHMGADGLQYSFSANAMEKLNLTESQLQEILSDLIDVTSDEESFHH